MVVDFYPGWLAGKNITSTKQITWCGDIQFNNSSFPPDGVGPPSGCAGCDKVKDCIKREMAKYDQEHYWTLVTYNCITAKNAVLRKCGLTDGWSDAPEYGECSKPVPPWQPKY
jgi:hypothetical protein